MAGGVGSRLWPLSRAMLPKQFLPLFSNETMFQETLERVSGINYESISVICNEEYKFFVSDQLKDKNINGKVILEPESKNTAPAICLSALNEDPNSILLVLSADHIIKDKDSFYKAVESAIELTKMDLLVTFGVVPDKPHTGYGYIKKGNKVGDGFHVEEFLEKPSKEKANVLFASQKYLWNSGMFLFKAGTFLEELEKHNPKILELCKKSVDSQIEKDKYINFDKEIFSNCPNISIDYAVMEKTKKSSVIPVNMGWSDVGSWSSLWELMDKDHMGNVASGDISIHNSKNSYIYSEDKLVAVNDVNDLIVIATKDSILISSKEKSEDIKSIVEHLKDNERIEYQFHREVHRPWGKYDSVDSGDGYQVKLITVKPGAKLSVQMHYHRSEHWVVVSGIARVHYGKNTIDLGVNESTYHDKEVVHALENPGNQELKLIEVQVGGYLGEDDIVRYEDIYGRS